MDAKTSTFERLPKALPGIRKFSAVKGILTVLIGIVLYVGHAAFIPVALAMLFGLILSSPVEWLHKAGIPRGLSSLLILIATLGALAGFVALLWNPVQEWYASAPRTLVVIQRKVTPVARLMTHLEELTTKAGAMGDVKPGARELTIAVGQAGESAAALAALRNGAVGLAGFVIITLFLLTGGPPMVARMTAAFFDHLQANHVQRTIEKVRAEVGQFYVTTALINLGLGIATALVMQAWHMPTPYVWGAMAAALNFIPYVGSVTTLTAVTLVALVSFDGLGHAVGVALSYLALAGIEGQFIQPLLVGRRLAVNPLLIFLGLWFGGAFWGIAGVILATPILVAFKVIAKNSLDGKSMMEFLGPNTEHAARNPPVRGLARGA